MSEETDLREILTLYLKDEVLPEEFAVAAFLWAGDVAPLIRMLRSDDPLPPKVRETLAKMLAQDEKLPSSLKVIWNKRGAPKDRLDKSVRNVLVGVHVAILMEKYGRGSYDAAIKEAAARAGVTEATARRGYALFKDRLPGTGSQ